MGTIRVVALLSLCAGCSQSAFHAASSDAGLAAPHDGSLDPAHDLASAASDGAANLAAAGQPDLAPDLINPNPPLGSTKCGSGTFAPSDARAVCMMPSETIDTWPAMAGGPIGRSCDAVTFDTGRFEAWCLGENVYLWARFDGIRATGSYRSSCGNSDLLSLDFCAADFGGSGGSCPSYDSPLFEVDDQMSTSAVISDTGGSAGKTARLFLLGQHTFETCLPMMQTTSGPLRALAGVTFTWVP